MIIITGNVRRLEDLTRTEKGCYIDFAIPTEYPVRTSDGTVFKTKWFNFRAYDRQAETIARIVRNGSIVQVVADLTGYMNGDGKPKEQYRFIHLKPIAFFGNKDNGNGNE
jgi:single-stranded DNA-binding protein